MGRSYKTAVPEFVDNFIYQPPWELMMATLQKKEDGIKNQLNEMEFLKNLPIDYIDYDKDLALSEKEKISAQVDDIASNFQKDLLNPNNKHEIQKLKRELQKSTTNGTIYNLQKNAETYRKFEAMRNALPDPNDREAYTKMFENYKNSNKELRDKGEFGQVFSPEEMYNSVNDWDNFTKSESFKALEPDMKKSKIDKINGAWVVTQGSETKSLEESKIGQAFQNYMKTQPGIIGRAKSREKYHNEKWLNDKGELDFTQGALSNMLNEGVPSLAYSQTGTSKDLQMNPVWSQQNRQAFEASEAAKSRAFQREQTKSQTVQNLGFDPKIQPEVAKLLGVSSIRQEQLSTFIGPVTKMLGLSNNINGNRQALYKLLGDKNLQKKFTNITKLARRFESEMIADKIASKQVISDLFGGDKTKTDEFFNSINEISKIKGIKHSVPLGNGNTSNTKFNFQDIENGKVKINNELVVPGTVKMDTQSQFIPIGNSNNITQGAIAIPITYSVQTGKSGTEPILETRHDFIYSEANNYVKD